MSRQEDFIQAGIKYRFEYGTPMAIGGGNFAEMVREMNRTKPFEAGAEYGYQYAVEKASNAILSIIRDIYGYDGNDPMPYEIQEKLRKTMEE